MLFRINIFCKKSISLFFLEIKKMQVGDKDPKDYFYEVSKG